MSLDGANARVFMVAEPADAAHPRTMKPHDDATQAVASVRCPRLDVRECARLRDQQDLLQPRMVSDLRIRGAGGRIRTDDLLFTRQLLCP
jgi:hypothetical protein